MFGSNFNVEPALIDRFNIQGYYRHQCVYFG